MPGEGVLQQPSADEATPPQSMKEEPAPACPEGQIFDEETGLCMLEETEVAEEPEPAEDQEEQPTEEEEQSAEEESGSEDNNGNN